MKTDIRWLKRIIIAAIVIICAAFGIQLPEIFITG